MSFTLLNSTNLTSVFTPNSMYFFGSIPAQTFYFYLGIAFIVFLILLPYLTLAGFCCCLYGGMICTYYIYSIKNYFKGRNSRVGEDEVRTAVAKWNIFFGKIFFGHEVIGMSNVPNEPTLFVLYHGPIPADSYFLYAKLMIYKKRILCAVANKNHLKYPGLSGVFKTLRAGAWNRKQSVEILKTGADLCVLPGGKYESRMSDFKYKLEWDERKGFAKVAKAASVPIVPVFTRNIQEAFWTPWYAKPFTSGRFSKKKQFLNIMCGGLPVKLTTVIGKPIYPDQAETIEDLAFLVKTKMQELIDQNQIIPGNKWRALMERCHSLKSTKDDDFEEFSIDNIVIYTNSRKVDKTNNNEIEIEDNT